MTKISLDNKIQVVELQLEEAVQMLRLVAQNKRTCLEVEEWLLQNYPESKDNEQTILSLLQNSVKRVRKNT